MWRVPREWVGEVTFIVAGGPSFKPHHAELLHGRKIVAINSAWISVPWADVLLFSDQRWWNGDADKTIWQEAGKFTTSDFKGRIVTTSMHVRDKRVLRLTAIRPPRWATDPRFLTVRWSTVTSAINYAWHAGSRLVVICGLDGKIGENGERHHHGSIYPWRLKPESFDKHASEFASIAPVLEKRKMRVLNANLDSRHDVWPRVKLEDILCSIA